jgi:hypothetical protein
MACSAKLSMEAAQLDAKGDKGVDDETGVKGRLAANYGAGNPSQRRDQQFLRPAAEAELHWLGHRPKHSQRSRDCL